MSEQSSAGRYNRSAGGLIGSMIVIVLLLVAFVLVRKLVTSPLDVTQPPVDYIGNVQQLQTSGYDPVYPATLPAGWDAFQVDYVPGEPPTFGISLHTDRQHYIGIQESSQPAGSLLEQYVDANPATADALATPGGVASSWAGWSDSGGDHAYTAKVGTQTVMVFGPADVGDLQTVVRSLTVAEVPVATSFPSVSGTASTGATTGPVTIPAG